jgi:PAS domain S-box-containing protein
VKRPDPPLHSPGATEERLLAALNASGTGTWKWTIAEDRVEWDEALARVYGVDHARSPRTAAQFLALVHPDDRARVASIIEASLTRDIDPDYEFRAVLPDGTVRWIYDRSKLVRDAAGQPLYILGACLDITKRKLAEQALADSRERLELAVTAAELGVWDWDLRTGEIVYSERAKAICGFPADAPVTFEQVRACTHPDDHRRTAAIARRALDPALREREPYEYRVLRPDGSVRWVLAHGRAIFETVDGVETAVRYAGTLQDITARRQIEKALRDSESRLRLAVDAGRMAIWEYDARTQSIVGSPELNRLLGFSRDATPSIDDLRAGYYPGEEERVRAAGVAALQRGDRFFEVEYRYLRKDLSMRWLLLRAEVQLGAAGTPERAIGVLTDVTDQRRGAERQQLLINELNHRVKNTLASIQSIAAQTLRHAADLPRAGANLEARLLALSRAHDLLTEQNWERARITAVVARVLAPFVADGSRLRTSGPDVWLAPKSAIDLAMALQELATNATKYGALSSAGGSVALEWERGRERDIDVLRLHWSESGGPAPRMPQRAGFGLRLLRTLAAEGGGDVHLDFRETGLRCTLSLASPELPTAEPGRAGSSS